MTDSSISMQRRFDNLYKAERTARRLRAIALIIRKASPSLARRFARRYVLPARLERGRAKLQLGLVTDLEMSKRMNCRCYSLNDYVRECGWVLRSHKIYLGEIIDFLASTQDNVTAVQHLADLWTGKKLGIPPEVVEAARQECAQLPDAAFRRCRCRC